MVPRLRQMADDAYHQIGDFAEGYDGSAREYYRDPGIACEPSARRPDVELKQADSAGP